MAHLPTNDELALAKTADLVALYNTLMPTAPVKKFVDRKTAIARVVKVVEAARAVRQAEAAKLQAEAGDMPATTAKPKKTAVRSGPKVPVVAALSRPRKNDAPVDGVYPTKASLLRALVVKHADNEAVLKAARSAYPKCNMTSVVYYRAQVEAAS